MLGEAICKTRINQKLSRRQLADYVGVSTQFIQQVENGNKMPSLDTASKLARALGCTVDDLLRGGEGETNEG